MITIEQNSHYNELIGKYIYIKQSNKEMDIHKIFKIVKILNEYPVIYKIEKYYYFTVPYNKECKCFCYEGGKDTYEVNYSDTMYVFENNEFIDTFRTFIQNDGKTPDEIPSKIIQDKSN